MRPDDLSSPFVSGFWVIIVLTDEIGAEWTVVVGICFFVRNRVVFIKCLCPTCLVNPAQQLIVGRIITFRFGEWNAVIGIRRKTHPETVSLYFIIPGAIFRYLFITYI